MKAVKSLKRGKAGGEDNISLNSLFMVLTYIYTY